MSLALASLILALAFFLRVYLLGDKSVWWDEAISAWTARKSALDIIVYQAGSVHPPLHYLLLHFWGRLAGESEFALRYSSALLGVATVAVLYRLGREFFGAFVAIAVALLLATSRFHVWWSQEIRMYSLGVLLGLLSLYFLLRALRDDKWASWLLYTLASVAALYTLYLNTLTIVAQNVLAVALILLPLLGRRKPINWLAKWALIQAAILLSYSPWLYLMKTHAGQRPASDVPTLGFELFWRVYATVLSLGIDTNIDNYVYLLPLPLLLVALGIAGALWDRQRRHLGLILLLYLTIAPLLIYALSQPEFLFYTPFVHVRYFLYLLPAFLLALAWGASLVGRKMMPLGLALMAVLAGANVFFTAGYYDGRFLEDDYKAMAATIEAHSEPSDAIVLYPDTDWPIFLYHYKGSLPWYPIGQAIEVTADWTDEALAPLLEKHRRLWLVSSVKSMDVDPQRHVQQWLSGKAQPVIDQEYVETRLTLFRDRANTRRQNVQLSKIGPAYALRETLPGGISVVGYDQWLMRVPSGGTAHIAVYWQDAGFSPRQYDYSIVLVDGDLATLASQQVRPIRRGPPGRSMRTQLAVVVPASTPGGAYRWQLRAADRATGAIAHTVDFGKLEVVQGTPVQSKEKEQDLSMQHPREVRFGDDVLLLGYDVEPDVDAVLKPGDVVRVTLYWRRLQQITTSYTVFVHLLGENTNPRQNNLLWGQRDSVPLDGRAPTTAWGENDVIADRYEVKLDDDAPSGHYLIEIGLYQRASGERLKLVERGQSIGDYAIVGEFDVE